MATLLSSGGTLKENTVEGQIMECLTRLFLLEQEENISNTSIGFNANSRIFSATCNLPVEEVISGTGEIFVTAQDYLPDYLGFSSGNGDIQAPSIMQHLHQLIIYAQRMEKDVESNPNNENRITSTTNTDTSTFSANFNFQFELGLTDDGMPYEKAIEYLVDVPSGSGDGNGDGNP
ncbi:hypothetical protein [Mastigocoleus testarum]|uniref:Uncharacterized protein n=1 Tax=Mastigocoleus testarum BC008 TaxID=371196 RepID=A0A0V7ZHW6_9CYAN|nr:hypothetical protein [Mastigocoleus testarum]KST64077.1 hypothetical protein BC008_40500 [Mastigocoleus testarum BC008]KST64787.1 hypothetical protein BC008_41475 [Mastigocoleus testarum BC008]